MRSYLFSASILSAITAGLGLLRRTLRSPLNWQIWLLWASWVISLVLAIAAVKERKHVGD
jgi:cytochrome c-type biogenesis protein CcmH/NrfF